VELLVTHIGQLLTPAGHAALKGSDQGKLTRLNDAFVHLKDGNVATVGLMSECPDVKETFDARGGVVLPGLVDCHTHAVFARTREQEFLRRCQSQPYGKGILTSAAHTRAASEAQLVENGKRYLRDMLHAGTTTVELKSGYGLDVDNELKLLRAIRAVSDQTPQLTVSTFLGAHAIPEGKTEDTYIDEIVGAMLPQVEAEGLAAFCDVFCDRGFFSVAGARRVLEAGKRAGVRPKLHADELDATGGAELAAEVGAISADHLLKITPTGIERMAETNVVAVLMPGTAFTLGEPYAPARKLIQSGVAVALGTDFNPGTCQILSMPTIISLAVMKLQMTLDEALVAATLNAACALERGAEVGSLEPGKRGDLVVFDLDSYEQLPYLFGHDRVRAVVCDGEIAYQNPRLREA